MFTRVVHDVLGATALKIIDRLAIQCSWVGITTGVLLRGPERSEGHVSSNDLVGRPHRFSKSQVASLAVASVVLIAINQASYVGCKLVI